MHNDKELVSITEIDNLRHNISLLHEQLYSDDITKAKNRLWVFQQKLNNNETFNDFGFLLSIKISDYDSILKEYDSNVGNKLLKQVSNYMMYYMKSNQLKCEIVRYMEDNFLIFLDHMNEEKAKEHVRDMQNGMSNYKFKHRSRVFQLRCNSAVMQYIENESFSSVLDQLDDKLFQNKTLE